MRKNKFHLAESLLNSPFEIEKISDSWGEFINIDSNSVFNACLEEFSM
jgi:hypothetical protein